MSLPATFFLMHLHYASNIPPGRIVRRSSVDRGVSADVGTFYVTDPYAYAGISHTLSERYPEISFRRPQSILIVHSGVLES